MLKPRRVTALALVTKNMRRAQFTDSEISIVNKALFLSGTKHDAREALTVIVWPSCFSSRFVTPRKVCLSGTGRYSAPKW